MLVSPKRIIEMSQAPGSDGTIRFGGYEADVAAGELRKSGRRIPVQEQPFQVLVALLERPGELVTREYLRERLWPGQPFVDFDQGLNTAINKLRDALGDSATNPRFVETVPRRGYRFTFPVDSTLLNGVVPEQRASFFPRTKNSRSWRSWALWLAAALLVAVAAFGMGLWISRPGRQELPLRRFTLRTGAGIGDSFNRSTAISPDGRRIAFINLVGGNRRLWIQHLEREQPVEVGGSDGAADPFWSPDSQFVGFALPFHRKLMRVAVEAGVVTEICPLPGGFFSGATWSPDGSTIVFGSGGPGMLHEVAATGGTAKVVVSHESVIKMVPAETEGNVEFLHSPQFLPAGTGRRVIVFGFGWWADAQMLLRDLDSGKTELLGPGRLPTYSPTGHLIFQSATGLQDLWAQPFSLDRMKTTGPAFLIARNATDPTVSSDGTLVYVDPYSQRLVWLNHRGERSGDAGPPMLGVFYAALSPDGQRVAFEGLESENLDIWVNDLSVGTRTRLSSDSSTDILPVWSPDGENVAYSSWRTGRPSMYMRRADAGAREEPLGGATLFGRTSDWSRDGRHILYYVLNPPDLKDGSSLGYLERTEKGWEPRPFLQVSHGVRCPKFSPDGRYVAYLSNESGRDELCVRPFPAGDRRWTVSNNGARQPRWSRSGRELFYVERGTLMVVPVRTANEFSAGAPVPLFAHAGFGSWWDANYDVSPDGERFLLPENVTAPGRERLIHVVQNWIAEFRNRH